MLSERLTEKNSHFLPFLIIWNDAPVNIFPTVSYSWPFFTPLCLFPVGLWLQVEGRWSAALLQPNQSLERENFTSCWLTLACYLKVCPKDAIA